ncbi:unnamed protein product, partial [Mesorhabditis belari]|uniref:G-protein coupled receptors family 1 profile domain-containing protein n=1 Tax=Mesorhabditis belari TaxID=2138241 RepID=A0AAF3EJP1_9BILA
MCHGHSEWRLVGCLIDIYLLPTLCLMGILLNSLCLAVFRTATHHPLVPTLITLSLCDLSQLTLSLFVLFIPAVHDYSESPMLGVLGQIAYLSTGLFAPLLLAANMASIWTMTYITMQRHRAIHNPLGHTAAPSRPFLPLICIVIVALTFNASKWFEYSWQFVRKEDISDPTWRESALPIVLVHQTSALGKNALYREVIDKVLYPVLVYIIPLLLLTILNFRILTTISRRPVPSDHKSRLAQERRAVTLIISIVLFFFCCHTGGLIFRWMNLVDAESDWSIVVKDVVNFLFNFNSACNPMLYFLFTRQFRDLRMSSLRRPFHGVSSCPSEGISPCTERGSISAPGQLVPATPRSRTRSLAESLKGDDTKEHVRMSLLPKMST